MKSLVEFINEAQFENELENQYLKESEETIKSEKDFRDYAKNKFKEVYADELDEDDSLFVQLMNMTQLLQKFEIDCSEINFDKRNNITIYFDGNIALLGNRELHDGQLACLKKIIDAGNDQKFKYDLRDWNDEVGEVIGKAIVDTEN